MTYIVFSKLGTPVMYGSQSPIVGTVINSKVPCYGPDSERLRVGNAELSRIQLGVEKEEPIGDCPLNDWRAVGYIEPRFGVLGFLPLYTFQEMNGVYDAMETSLPGYVADDS